MATNKAFYFKNSQQWRNWLTEKHATTSEAWLIHYKKHINKSGISYNDALEEALCFGWIDGKMKSIDEDKFMIRYSPRKVSSIWSKLNKERALRLMDSGMMTAAGMAKIEEARKNGYWDSAYTNKKAYILPLDLKNALIRDMGAWYNFQHFANSYKNNYIDWINRAKSEETRKRRISEVVKRSSTNKKPGME